jgi:hypothetical protein
MDSAAEIRLCYRLACGPSTFFGIPKFSSVKKGYASVLRVLLGTMTIWFYVTTVLVNLFKFADKK